MRKITRMLLPVLLLSVAVGSAMADMKDDVTAAYQAWNAAFNKGDAKAVAAFYTSDAKLLPPTHTVATGPAEIEKFFAGLANGSNKHALQVIEVGGADKVVYGAANWSVSDKDGKTVGKGIATHIFERQGDGSLKLKVHTFN